jgi:hypothetical protein
VSRSDKRMDCLSTISISFKAVLAWTMPSLIYHIILSPPPQAQQWCYARIRCLLSRRCRQDPPASSCLSRSLAGRLLLELIGVPNELHLGMSLFEDGPQGAPRLAHQWPAAAYPRPHPGPWRPPLHPLSRTPCPSPLVCCASPSPWAPGSKTTAAPCLPCSRRGLETTTRLQWWPAGRRP